MKKLIGLAGSFVLFLAISLPSFAFTDINSSLLYYNAVLALEDLHVVRGYSDGTFGYGNEISRSELLKIVYETYAATEDVSKFELLPDDFEGSTCGFGDLVQSGSESWPNKYICWAEHYDIIEGYEDGTFKPKQEIIYVEAQKIVLQVWDKDYNLNSDPWYKDVVDTAAEYNGISPTIDAFDRKITRSEMADLVMRLVSSERGEQDGFLGPEVASVNVTYDSIYRGFRLADVFDEICETLPSPYCNHIIADPVDTFRYGSEGEIIGVIYASTTDLVDLSDNPIWNSLMNTGVVFNDPLMGDGEFYISMDHFDESSNNASSIILYNFEDDRAEFIYRHPREIDPETDEANVVRLHGIDRVNEYFVVTVGPASYSAGYCNNPWIDENMYYIDMNDVNAGVKPYNVPQWKENREWDTFNRCLDEIEA